MIKILPIVMASLMVISATVANAGCTRSAVAGANRALPTHGEFNEALLDRAILSEANYRRCRSGLPALTPLSALRTPAQAHSDWMASRRILTHKSSVAGRRTLRDRVESTGIPVRAAAENLAQLPMFDLTPRFRVIDSKRCQFVSPDGRQITKHSYQSFAYKVVRLWMESPGHRHNLLSPKTTHMAAAATLRPGSNFCGDIYVTQMFIG